MAVVETMTIKGNVGFETSNLEFKGEVVVNRKKVSSRALVGLPKR